MQEIYFILPQHLLIEEERDQKIHWRQEFFLSKRELEKEKTELGKIQPDKRRKPHSQKKRQIPKEEKYKIG